MEIRQRASQLMNQILFVALSSHMLGEMRLPLGARRQMALVLRRLRTYVLVLVSVKIQKL
jgi:hypothetical protein